jgi:hypothetical protein
VAVVRIVFRCLQSQLLHYLIASVLLLHSPSPVSMGMMETRVGGQAFMEMVETVRVWSHGGGDTPSMLTIRGWGAVVVRWAYPTTPPSSPSPRSREINERLPSRHGGDKGLGLLGVGGLVLETKRGGLPSKIPASAEPYPDSKIRESSP